MSGGVRHTALAAAGLVAGLPLAAALQLSRPVPDVVWLANGTPKSDASNAPALGEFAARPNGPRLTVFSIPDVRDTGVGLAKLRLHPAALNSLRPRVGLAARFGDRSIMPDGWMPRHGGLPEPIVGRWRRGRLWTITLAPALPKSAGMGGPK